MSTSTQTHTNISTAELKNRVSALMSQAHEDLRRWSPASLWPIPANSPPRSAPRRRGS